MNLKEIINELMAAGISQAEIATSIGVSQATVSRYATGAVGKCPYNVGVALLELHLLRASQPPPAEESTQSVDVA